MLVFEAPNGAMRAEPEVFDVPATVTALALGRLDGGAKFDLAVAAGRRLFIVHGRDRKLSLGKSALKSVAPAKIGYQMLPFSVRALAVGSFSGMANLAALGDDGALHLLENAHALAHLAKLANNPVAFQAAVQGGRMALRPPHLCFPQRRDDAAESSDSPGRAARKGVADFGPEHDSPGGVDGARRCACSPVCNRSEPASLLTTGGRAYHVLSD